MYAISGDFVENFGSFFRFFFTITAVFEFLHLLNRIRIRDETYGLGLYRMLTCSELQQPETDVTHVTQEC